MLHNLSKNRRDLLKCGADEVGLIRIDGADNFYVYGRFRAGPQFAKHEPLFVRAYERSWREQTADWSDLQAEVDALGLCLIDPVTGDATRIRDFQLEALDRVWEKEGVPVEFKFIGAWCLVNTENWGLPETPSRARSVLAE